MYRRTLAILSIGLIAALIGCGSLAGPAHPHLAVLLDRDETILHEGRISLQATSRALYARYPDAFDFLIVFTLEPLPIVEIEGDDPAYYYTVRNDVRGIGFSPTYDLSRTIGSAARLQGIVYMGGLWSYWNRATGSIAPKLSYILAHELGHRFAAYVRCDSGGVPSRFLLDFRADHWTLAMDSGASPMGGHDWRDNGDGTFTAVARCTGPYSMLDLYLMGLALPEEVGPITVLDLHPRPYTLSLDTTLAAPLITKTLDDIIAVEGPRLPACGQASTSWRAAFVLVARSSKEVTMEAMTGMEAIRGFWPGRFSEVTRGRGTMLTEFPSD